MAEEGIEPQALVEDDYTTLDELSETTAVSDEDLTEFMHENGIVETIKVKSLWNNNFRQKARNEIASQDFNFRGLTCASAAAAETKAVAITNYELKAGNLLGITFTNGNTYGETTASTPTYPKLLVTDNTGDHTYPICDSRGHYAGKGFCNAGDYIELRFTGDKFCIVNSDIRESVQDSSSGYTIKSNGFCEQFYKKTITVTTWGAWGSNFESDYFSFTTPIIPISLSNITEKWVNLFNNNGGAWICSYDNRYTIVRPTAPNYYNFNVIEHINGYI
mgnify:CR=1 FL=1